MAIKSDAFGKTELTGKDARRFMEQFFVEKCDNQKAKDTYKKAKKSFEHFKTSFSFGG